MENDSKVMLVPLIMAGMFFIFLAATGLSDFTLGEAKSKVTITPVDAEITKDQLVVMFSTETNGTAYDRKIDYDEDFRYPKKNAIDCIKIKGKNACLTDLKKLIKDHKNKLIEAEAERIIKEQDKAKQTEEAITITKEDLINIAKD